MTKIQWTDESWNPVVGCTKVSPGCDNCYAEKMAVRLAAIEHPKLEAGMGGKYNYVVNIKGKWSNRTYCDESVLDKPFHWKKARKIFVCSMGDLFHESVPFLFIDKVIQVFTKCPQHTGILLTKRHERLLKYSRQLRYCEWPDNIIGMVTAENQKWADIRIPALLQCGFKTTGVSIEPMLGPVDLENVTKELPSGALVRGTVLGSDGRHFTPGGAKGIGLDWVIAGAESGSKRRYCKHQWALSIVKQCKAAEVPCFVKQLQENDSGKNKIVKLPPSWPREYPEAK